MGEGVYEGGSVWERECMRECMGEGVYGGGSV